MKSNEYSDDWYFLEVRLRKSLKNSPTAETIEEYFSEDDKLGWIKSRYQEITDKLSKEII